MDSLEKYLELEAEVVSRLKKEWFENLEGVFKHLGPFILHISLITIQHMKFNPCNGHPLMPWFWICQVLPNKGGKTLDENRMIDCLHFIRKAPAPLPLLLLLSFQHASCKGLPRLEQCFLGKQKHSRIKDTSVRRVSSEMPGSLPDYSKARFIIGKLKLAASLLVA